MIAQPWKKRKFRKEFVAVYKEAIPDTSVGTPPAGCRTAVALRHRYLVDRGREGCGEIEGREALPHTPQRVLFDLDYNSKCNE